MRELVRSLCLVTAFATASAWAARSQVLPDPKTGGAESGPVALLFLSSDPTMDPAYAQELGAEGFAFVQASYLDPLPYDFLRRFNVIVIDRFPQAAAEQDIFGYRMLHYWSTMEGVWRCMKEGAGVLVYTNLADGGGALCGGWNQEMKPWGIQILQACVLDRARAFERWTAYGENSYCWTESLADHPVTAGLRRIYYPTANLRWDDCYTAPPLICDATWTPIVKAMEGAGVATLVDRDWVPVPDRPDDLVLTAARPVEKGRLAVVSINPAYIHQLGYTRLDSHGYGEMSYGLIDGIILKKGDGAVPSDTGTMISRMYSWLAGDSAASGLGGYTAGEPVRKAPVELSEDEKAFTPVLNFGALRFAPSWRHKPVPVKIGETTYYPECADPLVKGEVRFLKALVGAHSALSDGEGQVAEYAAEARKAGYSAVVLTENFERLTRAAWEQLVSQCEQASTDDFVCLPGIDIMDPDNNHLLLIGPPEYPRATWLTPDGKRLAKTQMINLLYYNHLVVAHRVGTGPLPQERLKHFQGLSVFTYRGGKVVDNSLSAYAWQVMNGSNPHPIAVHEVFSPVEVADAAKTGFQQLMPSDTVRNAVAYFRAGIQHYFEGPSRYMISEGPVVTRWVIVAKDAGPPEQNRQHFRVAIGVTSDAPLKTVTLYDGPRVVRRWLPTSPTFETFADFQHSRQYGLYVVAEDAEGRRAITNSIRTVPDRCHFRCSDRQNWLGDVGAYYTGTYLPERTEISMPIKGTAEGSSIFTDVPGTCMATKLNFPFSSPDVVLTEARLDECYVDALFQDVGFDAMPSKAGKPSSVYDARVRHWSFTQNAKDRPSVALVEVTVRLKRDVEPVDPKSLLPSFGALHGTKSCLPDVNGRLVVADLPKDGTLDIPVGGLAGGIIPLTPGLRISGGAFGLAPQGGKQVVPAGTVFTARFLLASGPSIREQGKYSFDDQPEAWLRAMGFAGKTPYQLKMTRGTLESVDSMARMTPDHFAVAGSVTEAADIPFQVPMQIPGLNHRWTAGSWREGGDVAYAGVFEETAWPRLDVSKRGAFYAGNLLSADNRDLVLEIVKWTKDAIQIEAHNPTDAPIEATISTPKEIADHKRLERKVTVPPGSTVYVDA